MADTKISALTAVTAVATGHEFAVNDADLSKKASITQLGDYLFKRIAGSSGAGGEYTTLQYLVSATSNATTVLATVMSTDTPAPGIYQFDYDVIYQSALTSTGVDFAVTHSSMVGFIVTEVFVSTGGTAATGIADQVTSNTANMLEGKAQRLANQKVGATLGVDTANANMHMKIFGLVRTTAVGTLELKHCSEVTATSTIMPYTTLELTRISLDI